MVPALRATSTVRLGVPGGMVAIEVTSPARPRSSASARVDRVLDLQRRDEAAGVEQGLLDQVSVARVSMTITVYDLI